MHQGACAPTHAHANTRATFSPDKINTLASPDSKNCFFEMVPEWLPNRIRSVKQLLPSFGQIWARHVWAPHFSIDKNKALTSIGSQTLRTRWFVDAFATPLGEPYTFRADQRSGTTNTMLPEAASSKILDINFARQNNYF